MPIRELLFCSTIIAAIHAPMLAVPLRAEAPPQAEIDAAVERGIAYLQRQSPQPGYDTLTAVALHKSDVPADTPAIARVVNGIVERTQGETYQPGPHHYYQAGLELMLLGDVDAEKYRRELQSITQYVLAGQNAAGFWYYPNQMGAGDTSISQYALLGLWAAAQAGIEVPVETWDRAALWHLGTQQPDGGWAYHPGESGSVRETMTAAGFGSLHIARLHLHGGRPATRSRRGRSSAALKFGILERIDPSRPEPGAVPADAPKAVHDVEAAADRIDAALVRGEEWLTKNFEKPIAANALYYLYAIERGAALADLETFGPHDWYARGAETLIDAQQADGGWNDTHGQVAGTSFAILFLTKATARQLGRGPRSIPIGAGLLAGGRGLPANLDAVDVRGGTVETRKLAGPVDALLAELENPKSTRIEAAQQGLVETLQLGDREALVGQIDRLKDLVADRRSDVRRTALWALARSDDVRVAPLLIDALGDGDLAVAVEAHAGLCYLSRKPRGFGGPLAPLDGLPEDAGDEIRKAAVAKWRREVTAQWGEWYRRVRPYDERDDLAGSRPRR